MLRRVDVADLKNVCNFRQCENVFVFHLVKPEVQDVDLVNETFYARLLRETAVVLDRTTAEMYFVVSVKDRCLLQVPTSFPQTFEIHLFPSIVP
jgi:hypothetical protein